MEKNPLWHHLNVEDILQTLNVNEQTGISADELALRKQKYGVNALTPPKTQHAYIRFLKQFDQPLIYILIASAVITLILGEYVDGIVIMTVILLNGIVGYFQETGALKALDALKKTVSTQALVLREGHRLKINAEDIVVGDIVLLQSGDKIPADIRLIEQKELQVNESSLTGESLPILKASSTLPEDTSLGDRLNMLYASTYVTRGQGIGVVIQVGDHTEIGHISRLIYSAPELVTPLGKKLDAFSTKLLYIILFMAGITFLFGWLFQHDQIAHLLMISVALAVGAIPEGLPAAITTILAVGVYKMAKNNAIVRKLPVVETLGSTTVICSDKTGTLTENQMTVHFIYAADQTYEVRGSGYEPTGDIVFPGHQKIVDFNQHPALQQCLIAGLLCNDSLLVVKEGRYLIEGDPTEGALIVSAQKAGLHREKFPKRLDTIPFESERQFMATLHALEDDQNIIYLKGGAGKIIRKCQKQLNQQGQLEPLDVESLLEKTNQLASAGERVLAMAYKMTSKHQITLADVEDSCIFLGLQTMIDPPRKEVIESIKACQKAGIQIKMITGDHGATAQAIAEKLGLQLPKSKAEVITGKELESFSQEEFKEKVPLYDVFARVSPEQKLRIVEVFQAKKHIVAMTGDGVNDAPALKQSDIGIAMGITGTEVTKEAADMILTDDNFRTIRIAVEQGRMIFDNLLKFIVWTLPTNIGQGLVIMICIFSGLDLPILPVQILWINLTTAGILGLTLAFEPQEPGIMNRPPRSHEAVLISKILFTRMLIISAILVLTSFLLFYQEIYNKRSYEVARTTAVTVFIVVELFFLFNCRSLKASIFKVGLFSNPWIWVGSGLMLAVQAFYIYHPWMNKVFKSAPIPIDAWWSIGLAGLVAFLIIELEKFLTSRLSK